MRGVAKDNSTEAPQSNESIALAPERALIRRRTKEIYIYVRPKPTAAARLAGGVLTSRVSGYRTGTAIKPRKLCNFECGSANCAGVQALILLGSQSCMTIFVAKNRRNYLQAGLYGSQWEVLLGKILT